MTGEIEWRAYARDSSADPEAWSGHVGGTRVFLLFDDVDRGWCLTSRLSGVKMAYPTLDRERGEHLARELLIAFVSAFGAEKVQAMIDQYSINETRKREEK